MRFIHLINVRWYNATAWYAVQLANISLRKGDEVVVAGLPGSPPIIKAQSSGIKTFEAEFNSNNPLTLLQAVVKFNKFIEEFRPDVICCHRGEFFWYAGIKKLISRHNQFKLIRFRGDQRRVKKIFFNKMLYNYVADKIVATGNVIKKELEETLECRNVAVIYGGVDRDIFRFSESGRKKIRNEFNISNDDYLIGIIGRFDPVKGHEILFKAISHLYYEKKAKNIRLLVAGIEANMTFSDIVELLKKYGIVTITSIVGYREDIQDVMSALDLGVISSIGSEVICRVAFELMAVGVPVVASDVGVLPEVVPEGNIYHFNDYLELADKIVNHSKRFILFDEEAFLEEFLKILK
jgi:glycosyltransferase involved in cell wall biosynthesis